MFVVCCCVYCSYYYHDCDAWDWQYKHYYAPLVSDLRDLLFYKIIETNDKSSYNLCSNLDFTKIFDFERNYAFRPFEQLLAILPPSSSKNNLPKCYEKLMTSNESPLYDIFPKSFEIDMRLTDLSTPWLGVVKIAFFEEKILKQAVRRINPKELTVPSFSAAFSFSAPFFWYRSGFWWCCCDCCGCYLRHNIMSLSCLSHTLG